MGTDIESEWNVLKSELFLVQFNAHMDDKETKKQLVLINLWQHPPFVQRHRIRTKVGGSPGAPLFTDHQAKAKTPPVCDSIAAITANLDFSNTHNTVAAKDVFAPPPQRADPFCCCESTLSNPSQITARRRASSKRPPGNECCHRLSVTPDVWGRREWVFFID